MESILWFEKMLSSTDSTPTPSLCSPTEDIIIEDSFANEIYMKFVDESPGDHIDLFTEIDNNHEKSMSPVDIEIYNINDKIDLPIINDFVTPVASIDEEIKNNVNYNIMANNDQLLMEFNSILDSVQLSNELTPPQTPPPIFNLPSPNYIQQQNIPNENQIEIYEYIYGGSDSNISSSPLHEQIVYTSTQQSPSSSNASSPLFYEEASQSDEIAFDPDCIISAPTDIQRELEVVDELVRAHSRHNSDIDDGTSSISAFSVWSPAQSEYASSNSSQYGEEDDESVAVVKSRKHSVSSGLKGVTKKRPRAYGRNPEEKKYRKKEQNKNAATRYRQKKKQEIEIIIGEENILMDKNRKLMATYKETKREVKYLKSLLRDLFKARGFI